MPKMRSQLVWVLSVQCLRCGWIGTRTEIEFNERGGNLCPAPCDNRLTVTAEQQRKTLAE